MQALTQVNFISVSQRANINDNDQHCPADTGCARVYSQLKDLGHKSMKIVITKVNPSQWNYW